MMNKRLPLKQASLLVLVGILSAYFVKPVQAQLPNAQIGEAVPRDVREVYQKGLDYLLSIQKEDGSFGSGTYGGAGVSGMGVMVFLASGEDPNFGRYSGAIRKAVRFIIKNQDKTTGILGGRTSHTSMYNHGFAMLALSEAYGAIDERTLWREGGDVPSDERRSVGQALELAVRASITSQKKNKHGGWRYGPDATDADTSVSGAVLVGLLAARNAGIEVPDEAIDRAITYFQSMTSDSGQVAYSGVGGFGVSVPRQSIACLVYALARRKDLKQFDSTLGALTSDLGSSGSGSYLEYGRYYEAQALFHGDVESWKKWNERLIRELKSTQKANGSFQASNGPEVGTCLNLLGLALNYRFLPIYER